MNWDDAIDVLLLSIITIGIIGALLDLMGVW